MSQRLAVVYAQRFGRAHAVLDALVDVLNREVEAGTITVSPSLRNPLERAREVVILGELERAQDMADLGVSVGARHA